MIISERFKNFEFSYDTDNQSLNLTDHDQIDEIGDRNDIKRLDRFFTDISKRVI